MAMRTSLARSRIGWQATRQSSAPAATAPRQPAWMVQPRPVAQDHATGRYAVGRSHGDHQSRLIGDQRIPAPRTAPLLDRPIDDQGIGPMHLLDGKDHRRSVILLFRSVRRGTSRRDRYGGQPGAEKCSAPSAWVANEEG